MLVLALRFFCGLFPFHNPSRSVWLFSKGKVGNFISSVTVTGNSTLKSLGLQGIGIKEEFGLEYFQILLIFINVLMNKRKCQNCAEVRRCVLLQGRHGWCFPVVTAYVPVVGKSTWTARGFEQKAGLRSLPALVTPLWSYGASHRIRCACQPWRGSSRLQFYSCLPWWPQTVPQTLQGERWAAKPLFLSTFRVYAVCIFVWCKGMLGALQSRGKQQLSLESLSSRIWNKILSG